MQQSSQGCVRPFPPHSPESGHLSGAALSSGLWFPSSQCPSRLLERPAVTQPCPCQLAARDGAVGAGGASCSGSGSGYPRAGGRSPPDGGEKPDVFFTVEAPLRVAGRKGRTVGPRVGPAEWSGVRPALSAHPGTPRPRAPSLQLTREALQPSRLPSRCRNPQTWGECPQTRTLS